MERTQNMESARVDLRKLQLLNDRINQCLDALNQVRLSAHGLSHTTASPPGIPPYGYPAQVGGAPIGAMSQGIGYGGMPIQGQGAGFYGGLSHTPFTQVPQFQIPQLGGFPAPIPQQGQSIPQQGQYGPYGQYGQYGAGSSPIAGQYPVTPGIPGLSHSGAEPETGYGRPLWADPLLAARVRETFPFVQYPLPPVVSVY